VSRQELDSITNWLIEKGVTRLFGNKLVNKIGSLFEKCKAERKEVTSLFATHDSKRESTTKKDPYVIGYYCVHYHNGHCLKYTFNIEKGAYSYIELSKFVKR
jgi:hypothetical protein